MSEPPAIDASPLIVLARGGFLHLMRALAEETIVPAAVAIEVRNARSSDAAVEALTHDSTLRIGNPVHVADALGQFALGAGEEAVLAWAMAHPDAVAIIDEQDGRKAAQVLGVRVLGTLGVIIEAKKRGLIPAARPVVEHLLRTTSWYLDDDLRERTLRSEGE